MLVLPLLSFFIPYCCLLQINSISKQSFQKNPGILFFSFLFILRYLHLRVQQSFDKRISYWLVLRAVPSAVPNGMYHTIAASPPSSAREINININNINSNFLPLYSPLFFVIANPPLIEKPNIVYIHPSCASITLHQTVSNNATGTSIPPFIFQTPR